MPNTLDLDDEWGGIDLAESLERAFEIKFDPDEIKTITNIGSLFKIVERELGVPNGQQKCANAMAFYRLRRSLRNMNPGMAFEPETDLAGLSRRGAKRFFATLHQSTGLHMPKQRMTWIGEVGGSILLLTIIAFVPMAILVGRHIIASLWDWALAIGLASGLTTLYLDPGRLPKDCTTLGRLSKKVAILNYGRFARLGARSNPASLWENYVELICELSRLPKDEINAETVFFRHQLKAA